MKQLYRLLQSPRRLFTLDAVGACATLLGLLLMGQWFQGESGIPLLWMQGFRIAAGLYVLHSGLCAVLRVNAWRFHMRLMAAGNLVYCAGTLLLTALHPGMDPLLQAWLAAESALVIPLALLELYTAARGQDT